MAESDLERLARKGKTKPKPKFDKRLASVEERRARVKAKKLEVNNGTS